MPVISIEKTAEKNLLSNQDNSILLPAYSLKRSCFPNERHDVS